MQNEQVLNTLSKFKLVDKYRSFKEILPAVILTTEEQRNIVTEMLDSCCRQLILHIESSKRSSKIIMKKILVQCMDNLSIAPIDGLNREFAYQLGWFLAEKVEVNLRKGTEKKLWGYWQIEANEVKAPVRPRLSGKRQAKPKKRNSSTHSNELFHLK